MHVLVTYWLQRTLQYLHIVLCCCMQQGHEHYVQTQTKEARQPVTAALHCSWMWLVTNVLAPGS